MMDFVTYTAVTTPRSASSMAVIVVQLHVSEPPLETVLSMSVEKMRMIA